jgi:hypothetical protein
MGKIRKITVLAIAVMLSCRVMACIDAVAPIDNELWLSVIRPVEGQSGIDTIKNRPELVRSTTGGILRLTAGNGHAIGPHIKYMPEWRAFGWFTALDRIEWNVEVKKAGVYKVQLEWSVSDEEAGKDFLIETGRQSLTGIVAPSGSWETFKIEDIGKIKLKVGKQKIVFKPKKHFDKGALLDFRELKLIRLN